MVLSLIASTGLMALIIGLGGKFHEYFTSMTQIGLGLFLLFGKPLSKSSGDRFRKFEIIIGGILSLGVLGLMLMNLMI